MVLQSIYSEYIAFIISLLSQLTKRGFELPTSKLSNLVSAKLGVFNKTGWGTQVNSNDNQQHYPDVFKTLFEYPNFSNESQYANPKYAPYWGHNNSELIDPLTKKPVYSEVRSLSR